MRRKHIHFSEEEFLEKQIGLYGSVDCQGEGSPEDLQRGYDSVSQRDRAGLGQVRQREGVRSQREMSQGKD